jgi:hypothetical protein
LVEVTAVSIDGIPIPNQNGFYNFPLRFATRITQSDIGPNEDLSSLINSFVGGRQKLRRNKTKKRGRRAKI